MYSILIYGFPLILIVFEWGLKFLLTVNLAAESINLIEFTGPALAASALSFLMPLTRPKELSINIDGHEGVFVTSNKDSQLIGFIWLLVLCCLFSWAGSCYMSMVLPNHNIWGVSTHLVIGLSMYFLSLLMTFIKDKI